MSSKPDMQGVPSEPPASLKVILIGESQNISGYVVAFTEGDRAEAHAEVSGKGQVETVFPTLRPGSKQVVFVPHYSCVPESQQISLSAGQQGEIVLQLRAAGTFRGIVVDMLQRPIEGVEIRVMIESLVPLRIKQDKSTPIFAIGGAVGKRSYSYFLWSDGSLALGTHTNAEGHFEIRGVTAPSLQTEITYESVTVTQAWPLDREAYILLPVYKEPPPPELIDEEYEAISRAITDLMKKIGENPQFGEIYWPQVRELMTQRLSKSRLSEKEKAQLQKIIETVGRKPKSEEK